MAISAQYGGVAVQNYEFGLPCCPVKDTPTPTFGRTSAADGQSPSSQQPRRLITPMARSSTVLARLECQPIYKEQDAGFTDTPLFCRGLRSKEMPTE